MNEHDTMPAGEGEAPAKEVHHHHYDRRPEFNFGRLLFGLLIVMIGLAYLARSLGWLPADFFLNWSVIWPVAVILFGLSFLTGRGWANVVIGLVVSLLVLWVVGAMLLARPLGWRHQPMMPFFYGNDTAAPSWGWNEAAVTKETFRIDREPAARRARVALSGGAGAIKVRGGTEALVEGDLASSIARLSTSTSLTDGVQAAIIRTETGAMMMMGRWGNDLTAILSQSLPLELSIESGASRLEIDATRLVLERLDVKSGASDLSLALGDKADSAQVLIQAGASSVKIEVPRTAGVKVSLNSALTDVDLPDFDKLDRQTYQTAGYETAAKKIDLTVSLGASSLTVKRK